MCLTLQNSNKGYNLAKFELNTVSRYNGGLEDNILWVQTSTKSRKWFSITEGFVLKY